MNQSVDNAIGGYEDGHLVNVRDSALSPCPFCGGSNLRKGSSVAGHGESTPYIECEDCYARDSDWHGNPIKRWNARAPGIAMQDAFEEVFGKEPKQQTLQDTVNRRYAYNGFQLALAKCFDMQYAFEQVCDVFRNIQFVTGSDPKQYPIYAAATEGLRLAEPHCKPRESYVKSGIGQSNTRKYEKPHE